MRIDIGKVRVARKVLAAIQKKLRNTEPGVNRLHLEHYQNCREQGFLLVNYSMSPDCLTKWVAFSENRNSDSIVVYPSQEKDCVPFQGTSDESWNHREFFGPEEINKAADFCIKHILV